MRLHNLESRHLPSSPCRSASTSPSTAASARRSSRGGATATSPSRRAPRSWARYVNSAFSKTEAVLNGYDEAIVLTTDGHVSEGSAENLFMVRDGQLITPRVERRHPRGHHPRRR